MTTRQASPFGKRGGAILAFVGIALFIFALWSAGKAMDAPPPSRTTLVDSSRSFHGYAALALYLQKRGYALEPLSDKSALKEGGLLILTPPHRTDLEKLEQTITQHRRTGPAVVILPKWRSSGMVVKSSDGTQVEQLDASAPQWAGWHDELMLDLYPLPSKRSEGRWNGMGARGRLPEVDAVQSATGEGLVPLVTDDESGRILAGYLADGGDYPRLRAAAAAFEPPPEDDLGAPRYPLILVFEPDLLNNYGFSRVDSSQLADRLVRTLLDPKDKRVILDQALSGGMMTAKQSDKSLLKLAFTPPFLAATICLILAALVAFWRALHRFGPPVLATRAIAFGKRTLVANAAGLIQRARRLHLLGPPYADAARDRLAKTLALPPRLDPGETEAAIDRALALRAPGSEAFSTLAARLRAARRPADLVSAARQLHALERTLMR